MNRATHKQSQAFVAFAALLLLVSSVLTAWAGGAPPAGPTLDQFGNPLCITSGAHDAPAQQHGKVSSCCTLGCMAAPALPARPIDQDSHLIGLPRHVASNWRVFRAFSASPRLSKHPPRAPPTTPDLIII